MLCTNPVGILHFREGISVKDFQLFYTKYHPTPITQKYLVKFCNATMPIHKLHLEEQMMNKNLVTINKLTIKIWFSERLLCIKKI